MSEENKKFDGGIGRVGKYALYGGVLFFVFLLVGVIFNSKKKTDINKVDKQNHISEENNSENLAQKNPAEKIQIFLFHSTNRCYSCVTAGEYTKKILEQNFTQDFESGKIEFREVNIDLAENRELTDKFKAAGTSLFVNSIIDGEDNIKEDVQIWRLVNNEKSFVDYFSGKLRDLIGEEASENNDEMKKADIVFYLSDDCSECDNIDKYLEENDIENKINLLKKNINKDEADAEQMAEDAMYCNVDEELFGVPFLWAEGKCYVNEEDIIDFFKQS